MLLRAVVRCAALARHACRVTLNATPNLPATTRSAPLNSGLGAVLLIHQLGTGGTMTANRAS